MKKLMLLSFVSMFMVSISSFSMNSTLLELAPCEHCSKGHKCEKECKKGEKSHCCKMGEKKSEKSDKDKSEKSTKSKTTTTKSTKS